MKHLQLKTLLTAILFMCSFVGKAQCVSSIVCDTINRINVSTGISTSGTPLPVGISDPYWKDIVNGGLASCNFHPYWRPTPITATNACWINNSGFCLYNSLNFTDNAISQLTYERAFTVGSTDEIRPDFNIAYDDSLINIELVSPSNIIYPLNPSTPAVVYDLTSIVTSSITIPGEIGTWKIRVRLFYFDEINGFLLSGNIAQTKCRTVCCPSIINVTQNHTNALYCVNDTVTFSTTVNGVTNPIGYTYQWYHTPLIGGGSWYPIPAINGGNLPNYTTFTTPGLFFYAVAITQPNGICKDTAYTAFYKSLPSTPDTIYVNSCSQYIWYGTTYTTPGLYTHSFTDMFGCDSVEVLDLTLSAIAPKNCDTVNVINVSTGTSTIETALPVGVSDPFWSDSAYGGLASSGYHPLWQPTPVAATNAGWINNTGAYWNNSLNYNAAGISHLTYERPFTISTINELKPDFKVACDDSLINLELVSPSGIIYPLNFVTPAVPYSLTTTVTCTGIITGEIGTWKIKARVFYTDEINGFLLSGNIIQLNCDTTCCTGSTIVDTFRYTYILNGTTYSTPGTYTQLLTNANGCDSTITVILTQINTPLALTDVKLTGKQNQQTNILNWETTSKSTTQQYDLLISENGIDFSKLKTVEASEIVADGMKNIVNHKPLKMGTIWYRVKQYFTNGHQQLSNIVSLQTKNSASSTINVYPNPVANKCTVNINSDENTTTVIGIFNPAGSLIQTISVKLKSGYNSFQIDATKLTAGFYYLKTQIGEMAYSIKLIKN